VIRLDSSRSKKSISAKISGNYNKLMALPLLRRKNGEGSGGIKNQLPVAKKHARPSASRHLIWA
jgi:hypothetical protein